MGLRCSVGTGEVLALANLVEAVIGSGKHFDFQAKLGTSNLNGK